MNERDDDEYEGYDPSQRIADEVDLFWFKIFPAILVICLLGGLAYRYV